MRKLLTRVAVAALMVTPVVGVAPAVAATQHCPGHSSEVKIEGEGTTTVTVGGESVTVTVSGSTVTFSSEVEFCVKAGTSTSGVLVGDTYTVDFTNRGGKIPDISYVVIYDVKEECPYPYGC
jgi:hypothetical protein